MLLHALSTLIITYLSIGTTTTFINKVIRIMQDDLIILLLTIKVLYPYFLHVPSSLSSSFGASIDWSVLMAAYRLAAIIAALVD